ncbi:MAG: hypothetical protein ACR2RL_21920 [Gammaproteobacteria bacterium]
MPEPRPRALDAPKLLFAMPAGRRDFSALDTAARLAQITGASLRALLIEDPVLKQAADLPLTREYDRRSGSERAIDHHRVSRHLRVHERTALEHLQQLAEVLQLSSTLHVARGDYMREALRAALDADFAFIDPSARRHTATLSDAERRWLLGRPVRRSGTARQALRGRVVCAACFDDAENDRVLAVARSIATGERASLQRLRYVATPSQLRQSATERSGAELTPETLLGLVSQVQVQRGALLVLPRRALQADTVERHMEILARMPCPVLLVE